MTYKIERKGDLLVAKFDFKENLEELKRREEHNLHNNIAYLFSREETFNLFLRVTGVLSDKTSAKIDHLVPYLTPNLEIYEKHITPQTLFLKKYLEKQRGKFELSSATQAGTYEIYWSETGKMIKVTRCPRDFKGIWWFKFPFKRFGFNIEGKTSQKYPLEEIIDLERLDRAIISGERSSEGLKKEGEK